jgi:gluconate 5-dehydrogenase
VPEPTIQQLFDLSGRTALITGASGHLGRSLAHALAEAGARVVVASRSLEKAQATAAALGPNHLAVAIDHLEEASLDRGFAEAVELSGGLDVLVNNGHAVLGADWRSVTGQQFTRQLANATGYFLLARHMRDHAVGREKPASIILLGSMYGQVGSYPDVYEGVSIANPAAYQVLKGGVIQLTRHLAVYWAKDGVRVNCLSPGPFPSAAAPAEMVARVRARSPMDRLGQPHELKGALVFLASDASSYVTGHNLNVDGGWTAW